MDDMTDRIGAVAARVFSVPAAEVTDALKAGDIPQWDSMGHLNLFLAIESDLGVKFSPAEILGLASIRQIAQKAAEKV